MKKVITLPLSHVSGVWRIVRPAILLPAVVAYATFVLCLIYFDHVPNVDLNTEVLSSLTISLLLGGIFSLFHMERHWTHVFQPHFDAAFE